MKQDSKNAILSQIRSGKPAPQPLPEVPSYHFSGDAVEEFIKHLLAVDGRVVEFKCRADALAWLKSQPEMDAASHAIYSSAAGIEGNVSEEDISDLHNATKIEVCVTDAGMGVGEVGAVWVSNKSLRHAACALLARRLFVFVDEKNILGGMHDAYKSIKLREQQYGSFFTGPSATADIEAIHITGAQGPLAFTALIYNRANAPDTPELLVNPNADSSQWD